MNSICARPITIRFKADLLAIIQAQAAKHRGNAEINTHKVSITVRRIR